MRVMVLIKSTKNSEAGVMPSPELAVDMMKFNEELMNAGVLLAGDGLKPSQHGKRMVIEGGRRSIVDGPFAETTELVAGYWMWQVESMDEAMDWIQRCPDPMPGEDCVIEVRPVYEMVDFGDSLPEEARESEARMRAKLDER